VLFGTDFPVMKIRDYLDLFEKEDLDEDTKRAVLYENAERLLLV